MRRWLHSLWTTLAALHRNALGHDVFLLAASIAYTAMLSLFPLLIGLAALLSRFVDQAQARQEIVRALTPYLPPGVVSLVWGTLEAASSARGAAGAGGAVAIVGLFWTSTAVASALRHSLNRVLGVTRSRPFWRRKAVELVMVLLGGGLLSLSLITSAVVTVVEGYPPLSLAAEFLHRSRLIVTSTVIGPWVLSGAAFLVIYRFLPNMRVGWRGLLTGVATGLVLFETIKQGFFWYLRTLAEYPLIYSHLAAVVIFMVWVYLVALVLLIGAEVTGFVDRLGRRATDAG